MSAADFIAFLPETVLLCGILALFVLTLGERANMARTVSLLTALATLGAAVGCLWQVGELFSGAYRVDLFSQFLKIVFAFAYGLILLLSGDLPDIREDVRAEYYLFLALSVCGLTMLVSCVDLITLVVALELSSFPLYLLVAMRRERAGQRTQMESAIKYMMFGVAANGIMFFGMSYLFAFGGTTSLAVLLPKLSTMLGSPLVIAGLVMTFCGLFYKLAVFPFHFWTPDVYQGASNETAGIVASIPKIGGVAVLTRLVSLSAPGALTVESSHALTAILSVLAAASMFYGNLIALMQKDLKRLLGFSGIAHAGYALIGFVALDYEGYAAALYYIIAYFLMVLACFAVICKVSPNGTDVSIEDLAGLHRRSPLLALTLGVGIFALAGLPPFAGFMGKLGLLSAALARGYLWLVIVAVVNAAIAIYYYLCVVREAFFRDPGSLPPIRVGWAARLACGALIAAILLLGIAPARVLKTVANSMVCLTTPIPPQQAFVKVAQSLPGETHNGLNPAHPNTSK